MPLSPAPLPGTSPLPVPGRRPPSRRALRMAALAAVPVLVASLLLGQFALPRILFVSQSILAEAGASQPGSGGSTFQGFVYNWTRRDTGGGYTTPDSLKNMKFQAETFRMNTVIIPVVADMPQRSGTKILWRSSDKGNLDTFPDDVYVRAIQDARKAGLVPILELQLRQQDPYSGTDDSGQWVGRGWSDLVSTLSIAGYSQPIGALERTWFDNYTEFAVHYAQLSQQYKLPYFIIGDQLTNVSYDTAHTTRKADPRGIINVPGESFPNCAGRRDCEWRHVVQAIRSQSYATIQGNKSREGGGYTGKLIYGASWGGAKEGATDPEFEKITWWDAVDFVGVDAFFPLTQLADVSVETLSDAWHGRGIDLAGQKDIFGRLQKVADTYNRQVVFTSAGYVSAPGANGNPLGAPRNTSDVNEQYNDYAALVKTFSGAPFWAGVFWYADQPVSSREKQQYWSTSAAWAGDSLKTSKPAGQFLAEFYKPNPLPCDC